MKIKNKKTGEIVEFRYLQSDHIAPLVLTTYENDKPEMYTYNSLVELNAEWEDYEEPKVHWCITMYGGITRIKDDEEPIDDLIEIGNYFYSKEDAYDALVKLKAWKWLKDKNFHFLKYSALGCGEIEFSLDFEDMDDEGEIGELRHNLDLLFGGEE